MCCLCSLQKVLWMFFLPQWNLTLLLSVPIPAAGYERTPWANGFDGKIGASGEWEFILWNLCCNTALQSLNMFIIHSFVFIVFIKVVIYSHCIYLEQVFKIKLIKCIFLKMQCFIRLDYKISSFVACAFFFVLLVLEESTIKYRVVRFFCCSVKQRKNTLTKNMLTAALHIATGQTFFSLGLLIQDPQLISRKRPYKRLAQRWMPDKTPIYHCTCMCNLRPLVPARPGAIRLVLQISLNSNLAQSV